MEVIIADLFSVTYVQSSFVGKQTIYGSLKLKVLLVNFLFIGTLIIDM